MYINFIFFADVDTVLSCRVIRDEIRWGIYIVKYTMPTQILLDSISNLSK